MPLGTVGTLGGTAIGGSGQQGVQGMNKDDSGYNNGMVGMQGTGLTPEFQKPVAGIGGFNTAGYQYGITQPGQIQNSVMNNSGQFDTGRVDANGLPVSSVNNGQQYYNPAQDAYVAQARRSLDPQWGQQQEQQESQLTNMGLTRDSPAWNQAMQNFNLAKNDAYSTAMNTGIMNAGTEAARMQGMDVTAGNFANQVAQQNFNNQLTSKQDYNSGLTGQQNADIAAGTFANSAQNQGYTQQMGEANLNNAALGQQQGFQTQQDVGKMNLTGTKAMAAANVSAAMANAGGNVQAATLNSNASRDIAAGNQYLQGQQIALQGNQQNWNQQWGNRMNPILEQNALQAGYNPPTASSYPSPSAYSPAPTQPQFPGVLNGQQIGNTQVGSGVAGAVNAGASLGGQYLIPQLTGQ